jgi:GNAT superfamily N-acetyltransferase
MAVGAPLGIPAYDHARDSGVTQSARQGLSRGEEATVLHAVRREDFGIIAPLFDGFDGGHMADAIFEGHLGAVLADDPRRPAVAVLELRNELFAIFYVAGTPQHRAARAFVESIPANSEVFCASADWVALLKSVLGNRTEERTRQLLAGANLDFARLQAIAAAVPDGYRLVPMDLALVCALREEKSWFASSHGVNFDSPVDFIERGFGFSLLYGDAIASAASTFAVSSRGIEIQISTRDEHQRRGLAMVVGAALVAEALRRGLDPCWNAASARSARLAQRLGFTPDREVTTLLVGE